VIIRSLIFSDDWQFSSICALACKAIAAWSSDTELKLRNTNSVDELMVRSSHMTYRILLPDLLYIDAEKGYTTFVIRGGKTIKVRKTLSELMPGLPSYICRISKSQAVNLLHLDQFDHISNEIYLQDSKENFIVGDAYKASVKEQLNI
jgi:DNA-binding LytR/AlgR family response regulator